MPVQAEVSWPVPPYWAPMAVALHVPEVIVPNLVILSWTVAGKVVVADIVPVSEKYMILPEPTELKFLPVPPLATESSPVQPTSMEAALTKAVAWEPSKVKVTLVSSVLVKAPAVFQVGAPAPPDLRIWPDEPAASRP